jgi:voltage-gated potassium channel
LPGENAVPDPEVSMLSFLVVFRRFFQALARGWRDPQFRGLLYLAMGLLLAGTFFYHRVEDWTLFESFYFSVLTLTTVGYGDFTPQTVAGRAFTIFYVLIGLGIVVALMTQLASHLMEAHAVSRARRRGETGPTAQPSAG